MGVDKIIEAIQKWAEQFEAELKRLEDGLSIRIKAMQQDLLKELAVLMDWLEFDGKAIKNGPENIGQLRRLDGFFDQFERDRISKELEVFAKELLTVGDMTIQYYKDTSGMKPIEFEAIVDVIREIIGLGDRGELLKGGYLYNLGKTVEVRQQLRDYVLQSIVSKRSLLDFQKGLGDLVVGNADTEGALQKYWRQYAFDTFNQVHEVANKSMADVLGLKYFIYQGSGT